MAQFTDKIEPKDFPKMPKEYQDLLTRLLTIQADCEIGGPHIYVDHWTLRAPSVDDQWRGGPPPAREDGPLPQIPLVVRGNGPRPVHHPFPPPPESEEDGVQGGTPPGGA